MRFNLFPKFFKGLFFIFLFCSVTHSCTNGDKDFFDIFYSYDLYDNDPNHGEFIDNDYFSGGSYSGADSEEVLSFSAQGAWTISSSEKWLSINPSSGDAGIHSIYFSYSANTEFDYRKSTITLKGNDGTEKEYTFYQQGKLGVILKDGLTDYSIDKNGGVIEIPVKYSGDDLRHSFMNGCDRWIHIDPVIGTKTLIDEVVTVRIDENTSRYDRTGVICLYVSGLNEKEEVKISITQQPGIDEYLELKQSTYSITGEAQHLSCRLSASESVKASSPQNWISVLFEGRSYVSLSIERNDTGDARYGDVIISTKNILKVITIIQQPYQAAVTTYEYVENGKSYGNGVEIKEYVDGTSKTIIWAPVNCGQKAPDATSTQGYGMIYQWGYGSSGIYAYSAIHEGNGNTLRKSFEAGSSVSSTTWPSKVGNSDSDIWCNNNGPCPDGWRLPTPAELKGLVQNYKLAEGPVGEISILGYWCNGEDKADEKKGVFLPLAGDIGRTTKNCLDRGTSGFYWSSDCITGMNICASKLTISQSTWELNTSYKAWGFSVRCVRNSN